MRKKITILILTLTLPLFVVATLKGTQAQNGTKADEALPPGDWTLVSHPYQGPDLESMPVVAYSVTSDATKKLAVTKVGIWNRSTQPVSSVKLGWYLSNEENPDHILLQGQTPTFTLSKEIPPGGQDCISSLIVSFVKIHKPLLKGGLLTGKYLIDVAVIEVSYEDGSTWTREDKRKEKK